MVSRWWLASGGFPVLAGTLCSNALMFSVCAVSQGWKEAVDRSGSTTIISQPAWAVALEAVSLGLAAVAYIVLLLKMRSKHHSVRRLLVLVILLWGAAAIILFTVIGVVANQVLNAAPQRILKYTQGFYYGVFAAGLYAVAAILLTVYMASARSVHLTRRERRTVENTEIILRVFTFNTFLVGGAGVYTAIEGWSFMDAVYWADYTLLTIGIGNIAPKTRLGRGLLYPYAAAGITALALVVSSITSFSKGMRELHLTFKIREAGINLPSHRESDAGVPIDHDTDDEKPPLPPHSPASSLYPSKSDIRKAKRIKSRFHRRRQWEVLIVSFAAWLLLWLVSALIFRHSETSLGWTYADALYFTYTSLTTIGYGDLYPTSNFGKAFFVFWSLLAVPVLTNLITALGQLGFQTVTLFLRYIWRRGSRRNRRPPRSVTPSSGSTAVPSHTEPAGQGIDTGPSHPGRQYHSAKLNILLSEEISKLIATLKSESALDLHSEWDKVVLLLHPEGEQSPPGGPGTIAIASEAMHRRAESMVEFMRSGRADGSRDREILWMLTFLTERLSAELRDAAARTEADGPQVGM